MLHSMSPSRDMGQIRVERKNNGDRVASYGRDTVPSHTILTIHMQQN